MSRRPVWITVLLLEMMLASIRQAIKSITAKQNYELQAKEKRKTPNIKVVDMET